MGNKPIQHLTNARRELESIDPADVREYGPVMKAKENLDNAILDNL